MKKPAYAPKALKKGDRIGIIAPSGAPTRPEAVDMALEKVRALGFVPVLGEGCRMRHGYLAGPDDVRAHDAQLMLADPTLQGVWCLRGGYGVTRILDLLDYGAIQKAPKVVMGYSDITALHAALNQRCGWITFHAPMPGGDGLEVDSPEAAALLRAVASTSPLGMMQNPPGEAMEGLSPGCAEGQLCGGNLSLVTALLGTPYEIDTRGKILFLEDIGEHTYRIDRMLNHLRMAGALDRCAGILLGTFTDCEVERPEQGLTLMQVFDELLPKHIPVLRHIWAGHVNQPLTLPLGARCVLDADACAVCFPDPAVC